jgi:hypothetical protein
MKINPNAFNSHFLNTAEDIQNISAQITSNTDNNSNYKHYLNLTAKGPFPYIVNFSKITTKEIEKVIFSFRSKNSSGYDEISMKN